GGGLAATPPLQRSRLRQCRFRSQLLNFLGLLNFRQDGFLLSRLPTGLFLGWRRCFLRRRHLVHFRFADLEGLLPCHFCRRRRRRQFARRSPVVIDCRTRTRRPRLRTLLQRQ